MTRFQFPLQKALDWRRTQLGLTQARVEQQMAVLAEIDRERAELDATGQRTEAEVRQFARIEGGDLSALGSFRLQVKAHGLALGAKRVECQNELAARQAVMLEARRCCRLLERLKERRLSEWNAAANKELDQLAAESYLARWARRQDDHSDHG